ncbi:brachyurin-like [Drosophila simulans]|uniref:brachyurin-like n=1 Tax=Drosophila simulans TaxID=7240 RepID=UPI00192CFBB0|nr:brachyurin-like [Drosophila simulans]
MQSKIIISLTCLAFLFPFVFTNKLHRIINGHYAASKQFPYQTFLMQLNLGYIQEYIQWHPLCGGALISEKCVLTAAHCLDNPDIYAVKIYFGAVKIDDVTDVGQQRLVVKRDHFVIHQEWNSITLANDIALIKLPFSILFDDYIKPIQLPNQTFQYQFSEATTSGWGFVKDTDTFPEFDKNLKYFNAQILSDLECKRAYILQKKSAFPASLICIAPGKNMVCKGDSGGPLVIKHESNFVLLGLTSFMLDKLCDSGFPSFFTRVSSYLNWIRDNAES